jgi:hypothetical protein
MNLEEQMRFVVTKMQKDDGRALAQSALLNALIQSLPDDVRQRLAEALPQHLEFARATVLPTNVPEPLMQGFEREAATILQHFGPPVP